MFKVKYQQPGGRQIVVTVYAIDRAPDAFLIARPDGGFEWVPIYRCILCEPD